MYRTGHVVLVGKPLPGSKLSGNRRWCSCCLAAVPWPLGQGRLFLALSFRWTEDTCHSSVAGGDHQPLAGPRDLYEKASRFCRNVHTVGLSGSPRRGGIQETWGCCSNSSTPHGTARGGLQNPARTVRIRILAVAGSHRRARARVGHRLRSACSRPALSNLHQPSNFDARRCQPKCAGGGMSAVLRLYRISAFLCTVFAQDEEETDEEEGEVGQATKSLCPQPWDLESLRGRRRRGRKHGGGRGAASWPLWQLSARKSAFEDGDEEDSDKDLSSLVAPSAAHLWRK